MLKQNEEMTDCPICCEEFTMKVRASIKCGHCDFTACKQCVRKFAINPDTFDEPHCMSCNGKWDRSFFKKSVNTSWFNGNHGYKQHMKNGLFHLVKARFPETMEAVSNYVKVPQFRIDNKMMEKELGSMEDKVYQLKQHIRINKQNIERFSMGLPAHSIDNKKKEKKVFIHRCPAAGCLGFLSSAWKCGICNVWACSNCGEIKGHTDNTVSKEQLDEQHVCKPENIESTKMIKKDTRPCPDCAVPIFKISGCDQMWCTQCHIAFSWNTGRKVNGVVHNPHFYAWARENNTSARRVVGEVACGGIPDRNLFTRSVREFIETTVIIKGSEVGHRRQDKLKNQLLEVLNYKIFTKKNEIELDTLLQTSSHIGRCCGETKMRVQKKLDNIWYLLFIDFLRNPDDYHRRLTHFRMVELDNLRRDNQNQRDNKMLRIQYLSKEITQQSFETKLLSFDKQRRKKTALLELFELVNTVFTETFIDIINQIRNILTTFIEWKTQENYEELMLGVMNNFKRIVRITCYANKQLRKISDEFNLCVPHICFNLRMYSSSWKKRATLSTLREYIEPNNDATIVETQDLKDWIAINQMQKLLNRADIVKHPIKLKKRIINVLYTVYGGDNKTNFNINIPIHQYDAENKLILKAPIPIIILELIKTYLEKKIFVLRCTGNAVIAEENNLPRGFDVEKGAALTGCATLNHTITKLSMNVKTGVFLDYNEFKPYTNNTVHEQEIKQKVFEYYKKAYNCYMEFMTLINNKKMPYNRNIRCSKGKTIKWYEEHTFPKIINV